MQKPKRLFEVWYAKKPTFHTPLPGQPVPHVQQPLEETHTLVTRIVAVDINEVYWAMQGEIWSPCGEARPIIESLGLYHTSMSIGDVMVDLQEQTVHMVGHGFDFLLLA
jgi:hypothetical protein